MRLEPLSREERYTIALVYGIKKDYQVKCWNAMIAKNKYFRSLK